MGFWEGEEWLLGGFVDGLVDAWWSGGKDGWFGEIWIVGAGL